jgi:ketosteroid isomerase-like protein
VGAPARPVHGAADVPRYAELLAFWARLDGQWDEFRSEAKEYIDAGERVVVPGRVTGRGRTSGATPSMLEVEVLTVSGGRITRRESYADLAHALEAVGPTERRT